MLSGSLIKINRKWQKTAHIKFKSKSKNINEHLSGPAKNIRVKVVQQSVQPKLAKMQVVGFFSELSDENPRNPFAFYSVFRFKLINCYSIYQPNLVLIEKHHSIDLLSRGVTNFPK